MPRRWWMVLALLLPLVFNPVSRWQFEPDKSAALAASMAMMGGWSWRRGVRLRGSWIEALMLLYLTVALVALLPSEAPDWGFWGDPTWRNGWLQLAAGFVLFWLVRTQITTAVDREAVLRAFLIGAGITSTVAVAQALGFDPLHLQEQVGRVPGLMAHPNLLAAYLAMALPLACVYAIQRPRWGVIILLITWALIATYSRSGWLAALGGTGTLILLGLWVIGRQKIALRLGGLGALGLIALVIASALPPLPESAPHLLQNLTNMFRWQGATAQIRLHGWGAALDALPEAPLLGHGTATYRFVLARHLPAELAPFGGGAALDGRVHNRYLEILLENGVIGLGIYLALLGLIFWRILRKTNKTTPWRLAILAALVANAINNFFSFDSASTWAAFWLLAGLALPLEPLPVVERSRRFGGLLIAVGGILLALWMIVPDMLAYAGEKICQNRIDCDRTEMLQLAADLCPTPDVYLELLALNLGERTMFNDDAALRQRSIKTAVARVDLRPAMPDAWSNLGHLARRFYASSDNGEYAEQALVAYTEAILLSPRDPDRYLDRASYAVQLGDYALAEADLEQAGALLPDYVRYFEARSSLAFVQGDFAAAENWQQQALEAQQAWEAWVWRR